MKTRQELIDYILTEFDRDEIKDTYLTDLEKLSNNDLWHLYIRAVSHKHI